MQKYFWFLKKLLNWIVLILKELLFSVMPFFYLGLGLNRLLIHSGHIFKCVMIM